MAEDEKSLVISTTYEIAAPAVPIEQVEQEIRDTIALAAHAHRDETRRAYDSSWKAFQAWCSVRSLDITAVTPEMVATYLQVRLKEGLNPRSLVRAYSAIASRLREIQIKGEDVWARKRRPDIIYRVLQAARNDHPTPVDKKKPLRLEQYMAFADPTRFERRQAAGEPWIKTARDRALVLFGLAGGFRRSELVSLKLSDLDFTSFPEGAIAVIRKSKTDKEGIGAAVAVYRFPDASVCAVKALEVYVEHVKKLRGDGGFVFLPIRNGRFINKLGPHPHMCDDSVALIVKAAAEELGLDPTDFAGHSLRSGFVSIVSARGATIEEIMQTTRHRSFEQVRDYIQRASPFERNASRFFFDKRG